MSQQKTTRDDPGRSVDENEQTELARNLPNIIIFGFFLLALLGRLERNLGVLRTVRPTGCLAATEGKFRIRWITDRPFAHAVAQSHDRCGFSVCQRLRRQRGQHG